MSSQELLRKIQIHIETTEECLDNFELPNYVVELLNQDLELFNEVVKHLENGGDE